MKWDMLEIYLSVCLRKQICLRCFFLQKERRTQVFTKIVLQVSRKLLPPPLSIVSLWFLSRPLPTYPLLLFLLSRFYVFSLFLCNHTLRDHSPFPDSYSSRLFCRLLYPVKKKKKDDSKPALQRVAGW